MRSYEQLGNGLDHLYLEDSHLLGFVADGADLSFIVDAVQSKTSPYLTDPKPGDQYSYRRVAIRFPGTTSDVWHECSFRASMDASGAVDFDNIDAFQEQQPGVYRLTGAWGDVTIQSQPPVVEGA